MHASGLRRSIAGIEHRGDHASPSRPLSSLRLEPCTEKSSEEDDEVSSSSSNKPLLFNANISPIAGSSPHQLDSDRPKSRWGEKSVLRGKIVLMTRMVAFLFIQKQLFFLFKVVIIFFFILCSTLFDLFCFADFRLFLGDLPLVLASTMDPNESLLSSKSENSSTSFCPAKR